MESREAHAPHPPHTGHRWLDLAMGGAALLISRVSLYVGIHHGHTMETLVVRVDHCPVPQTPYQDDLTGLMLSKGKLKAQQSPAASTSASAPGKT